MWVRPRPKSEHEAEPYCGCTIKRTPVAWAQLSCSCGEENDLREWRWQRPEERLSPETEQSLATTTIVVSEDQREVTFHPFYSSGTALVRGDTPLEHGCHYYWEVKMLTESYGTDIMVGLGTDKVNTSESMFKFTSLLGSDAESYGLSYKGGVRHAAATTHDSTGFCRGSLVGVRVDMWQGTLEFYLNRKPQGVSFYNLRRHPTLYPMVCSTAAQSSMRLAYAASWRASLLVDAAKVLAHSVSERGRQRLPPGLWRTMKGHFWLTLPTEGCIDEDEAKTSTSMEAAPAPITKSLVAEVLPSPFINGFYVDSIERDYRVVVWE